MALVWAHDGRDWPQRETSRFVQAGGLRWHVQQMGGAGERADKAPGGQRGEQPNERPVALLIHGTGASTHSWRGLMPLLARRFTVVAMDLPGHAFTEAPAAAAGLSLPGMANAVAALVGVLGLEVDVVVGHSAGAAIAARAVLDGALAPSALVAINGAFLPLAGWPGLLFPPVARLMAATPFAAQLFARRSWDAAAVERLIGGTGSTLDAHGLALYAKLMGDARHAAGALGMMARWDLRPLAHDLTRLRTPLTLIVGANDRAVPPRDADRVRSALPTSTPCSIDTVPVAGHLVHEEHPADVAQLLFAAACGAGQVAP